MKPRSRAGFFNRGAEGGCRNSPLSLRERGIELLDLDQLHVEHQQGIGRYGGTLSIGAITE